MKCDTNAPFHIPYLSRNIDIVHFHNEYGLNGHMVRLHTYMLGNIDSST